MLINQSDMSCQFNISNGLAVQMKFLIEFYIGLFGCSPTAFSYSSCSRDVDWMLVSFTMQTIVTLLYSWWRRKMEPFSALLAICARNSPVTGAFPVQRPVTRSFDVFFDLRLNKRLSKQIVRLVIWDDIAPIVTSL